VQDHVREDALAEAVAEVHQGTDLGRPDAVDRSAQPRLEGNVLHRLQQQRIQVEHAELPVAHPRLALAEPLEGAHVHERRARALELDVVGRRVLQHHVVLERREQEVELQQRGVLQHRERPLVRVRDERDPLVPEDRGGLVDEEAGRVGAAVGPLGGHHPLAVEQAGGLEGLEVAQPVGRERAEYVIARVEDSALGIAERPGLEPGGRVLS
jgi:hypothetical protein